MADEQEKNSFNSLFNLFKNNRFFKDWFATLEVKQHKSHSESKSIWQWILSFFGFGKKKKHHHSHATPAANESNIVDEVLKEKPSENATPQGPTQVTSDSKTTLNLGADQKSVEVELTVKSDDPNVITSSSNVNDYKFLEARNVEGVEKNADLDAATKEKAVKAIAQIEDRAYQQTAEEMGFELKKQDLGNGRVEYTVIDPHTGKPINEQQLQEFKELSTKNFNDLSKGVCDELGLNFSLVKQSAKQPEAENRIETSKNKAPQSKPTPTKSFEDEKGAEKEPYKSPSPFSDPSEIPSFVR